jgi:DNA-binding NarL/FixJ family response regulator
MMPSVPISILIVDDHAGFRRSAKRALEADGFSVIGEAGDLATGLSESARLQPDVVLLDIHLPDGSGMEQAPEFVGLLPGSSVVLVSTYDEVDLSGLASDTGIAGFLPKAKLSGAALASILPAPPAS